jgi:nicotinamide-nucleotide amidase
VPLVRDGAMVANIEGIFRARQREMPENNARQADLPKGATFIPQVLGTAPGLICERDEQVLYAVPGVPHEMKEMLERAVVPDLVRRAGSPAVILSRLLRTWGLGESSLAQRIADRVDTQTNPTIAFLAQGVDGMNLRITAKAEDHVAARRMLDAEEAELRALLEGYIFGVDDQTIEKVVGDLLVERGLSVGVAESLTSGLVAARLAEAPGASKWFKGSIVAYTSQVKFDLLDVPEGPVVSAEAAVAMAEGAREKLRADVALGVTGVAGPTRQEDQLVGTVFMAVSAFGKTEVNEAHFPGDRQHVRQFATITLLDFLRRRLLEGN